MNIAIVNLKVVFRYLVKITIIFIILVVITRYFNFKQYNFKVSKPLFNCIRVIFPYLIEDNINKNEFDFIKVINYQLGFINSRPTSIEKQKNEESEPIEKIEKAEEKKQIEITTHIDKIATTEKVNERNIGETSTHQYGTVRIKNSSIYDLTTEMMTPDKTLSNKNSILIYHTHTCECYTPSEMFSFTMTGNYRTTDEDYNMVRVGKELNKYLTEKGFSVTHSKTCHDYPSYSGSYDRSLQTANDLIYETNAELIFDLHRDAVGDGNTYGPTVKVNGESVAQLMFVIGTDGGGSEHPNWVNNLKIAIQIQEKANEMYPGLFRPIILRNSRYNQHIATGAAIIEVGATANTLEESLLSMQCLANVLEELYK